MRTVGRTTEAPADKEASVLKKTEASPVEKAEKKEEKKSSKKKDSFDL